MGRNRAAPVHSHMPCSSGKAAPCTKHHKHSLPHFLRHPCTFPPFVGKFGRGWSAKRHINCRASPVTNIAEPRYSDSLQSEGRDCSLDTHTPHPLSGK